jgi:uncharacterized ion transporter superfamily protein YfcC
MLKKVPHTYVIVFIIIVIACILSWVVTPGKYIKETVTLDGKEQAQMVYYTKDKLPEPHKTQFKPQTQTWHLFTSLYKGFEKQAGIIVFILVIGGAFWVMNQSKAIDVGIMSFLKRIRKMESHPFLKRIGVDNLVIISVMLLFSVFGAVFGMSEETIAFVIILIPLAISMGYDSITGVGMVYMAAHVGFAGAVLNPFTIGIAQGLAGVPLFSGIEYRIFCWIVLNITSIAFLLFYGSKIRKNPKASPMYEEDNYWRNRENLNSEDIKFYTPVSAWSVYVLVAVALVLFSIFYSTSELKVGNSSLIIPAIPVATVLFIITGFITLRKTVHFYILTVLGFTIVFLIIGVMAYGWYIKEITALFLAMGIISGITISKTANEIAVSFIDGMKDILSAAVIVGLAGGIIVVLEDGGIIDSILHSLSKSLGKFGAIASVQIMFGIQTIINIFIPSGSAKAAITMPLMAPFGDLIGISRQATVMAFQFGDGFTNMITPTSGVLIGVLGIARIPYHKWFKWVLPFIVILTILGMLLLIPTVTMTLNGF